MGRCCLPGAEISIKDLSIFVTDPGTATTLITGFMEKLSPAAPSFIPTEDNLRIGGWARLDFGLIWIQTIAIHSRFKETFIKVKLDRACRSQLTRRRIRPMCSRTPSSPAAILCAVGSVL